MIESISIKNIASYDDSGVQINDLKKINFIYGANGSGKTTISNFLASQKVPQYQNCEIVWQYSQQLQSLVYNKKFRENNFGKGTIEGIFTLGQATKEEIELIEQKQAELKKLKEEGIEKKKTLDKQKELKEQGENNFKEDSWAKVYKKYEHDFKEAFKGTMQKETFKIKLLTEFNSNIYSLLTFDELKEKSKIIFGKIPEAISYKKSISFDRLIQIENEEIWTKKILGKSDVDVAALIKKLNINDWVNQGRSYLQDDDICPFCQQSTITDEFKNKLEGYFDESFTASIKQINALNDEYNLLAVNIINELVQTEANEKTNKATKLNIDTFSAYVKTLLSQFITNKELLNNKIKEPSRDIKLISLKDQLQNIDQLITEANREIKKHNDIVSNYQTEKVNLINGIWRFLVEEFKEDIEIYKKKSTGLQLGIDVLEKHCNEKRQAYKCLSDKIKELTNNVTSIEPTVNKINTTLRKFGFLNFEIVPSKLVPNNYQLQREDGELAESSLSEGEITFITFLYFMQLAKGATTKEAVSEERILVVDDPISSLDSTILFVVSILLKGVIEDVKNGIGNIKQVIVLTHNVYFHKEASFINGREKVNINTNYWILRKNNKMSTIQSFGMNNPIQTSYELLWQELKNKNHNSLVTIQNTIRRIIENYFKILGKYRDDDLIHKFTTQEEQEICRSLICWINDGSHSIADDLFIELQDNSMDKYLKVFEDIFVLTDHKGHYDMMMGIDN